MGCPVCGYWSVVISTVAWSKEQWCGSCGTHITEDGTIEKAEWGIKCNMKEGDSKIRTGALCWIANTNGGSGNESMRFLARSRGGRRIDIWMATKKLNNFRVSWVPEHLRDKVFLFAERPKAKTFAIHRNIQSQIEGVNKHG